MKPRSIRHNIFAVFLTLIMTAAVLFGCTDSSAPDGPATGSVFSDTTAAQTTAESNDAAGSVASLDADNLPQYSGEAYAVINNNQPEFLEKDLTAESFEYYGEQDSLGRCTTCFACVGKDLMPTGKRGNISSVKPTGWQSVTYDNVEGGSLYNRCHLIAYQLTGENANERNLITGTRYMNATGMLPFEEQVGNYVRSSGNHVLYRVTPIFVGEELVARGVQMEAVSIEDEGKGICFNVYCFNVQPDIEIDYATGDSHAADNAQQPADTTAKAADSVTGTYILNTSSKKFHSPDCPNADTIKDKNKKEFTGSRDELLQQGYSPCGQCKP